MTGHRRINHHSELHCLVKRLKVSCMNSMICRTPTNKILMSWINTMKGFKELMPASSKNRPLWQQVDGTRHRTNRRKTHSCRTRNASLTRFKSPNSTISLLRRAKDTSSQRSVNLQARMSRKLRLRETQHMIAEKSKRLSLSSYRFMVTN